MKTSEEKPNAPPRGQMWESTNVFKKNDQIFDSSSQIFTGVEKDVQVFQEEF